GATVTDVASTKAGIVRVADQLAARRALAFVGSHPMAGSERSGYGVARADLFRAATVILTPTDRTEPRAVKAVTEFWEAMGARDEPRRVPAGARGARALRHAGLRSGASRRAREDQGGTGGDAVRFRVRPVDRLAGTAEVPGDKSISHRAALLGALADGVTEIHGYLEAEDCLRTIAAVQALGAEV